VIAFCDAHGFFPTPETAFRPDLAVEPIYLSFFRISDKRLNVKPPVVHAGLSSKIRSIGRLHAFPVRF
jgi:hypothetical protein